MKAKLIGWGVVAVFYLYVLCHISALVGDVGYIGALMGFVTHIIEAPFDVVYFNKSVFIFGWLLYAAFFFLTVFKQERPKAEMKGNEHGNAHFQTDKEMNEFLKKFSTPILGIEDVKEDN